jgi:hypothetical protein
MQFVGYRMPKKSSNHEQGGFSWRCLTRTTPSTYFALLAGSRIFRGDIHICGTDDRWLRRRKTKSHKTEMIPVRAGQIVVIVAALVDCAMDFFESFSQTIAKFPARIVFLKFPHIGDPPDVVSDAVRLLVVPS